MTEKLKAWIGLKLVTVGIWILELQPFGLLDNEDKEFLRMFWAYHDKFNAVLDCKR